MSASTRVLFLAETVTLAHLARPIALARGLDPAGYDISIACDPRYQRFLADTPWRPLPLDSISSQQFLQALAQGKPVYDAKTLHRYVKDDLRLIDQIKPDVIVGDFRLSLSISARLTTIPYLTITNAYWSPYFAGHGFPLPVLPVSKALPLALAQSLFRMVQPLAFRLHCHPLNQVRKEHGLASLGNDLRRVYTDADHVLYADLPELFQMTVLPNTHHHLGPLLWSPPVALPAWWNDLPSDKPLVYLTLGSSGQIELLPTILSALADLPVTVIAASAGGLPDQPLPPNVRIADYLPGTEAAARSSLVICNGGSLTSQQALVAGVPVLGIASNMDQFLNMGAITAAGAGRLLRADRLDKAALHGATAEMLAASGYRSSADRLALRFAQYRAEQRFAEIVQQVVAQRHRAAS